MMTEKNFKDYLDLITQLIVEFSPNVITAILILLIGLWSISIITKTFKRIMIKRNIEITLSNFIGNLLFWALRILLFITVIAKLGVETSSFVAVLGAAGLAVGLALQGSLSNFAGGILIILFKPFKVFDVIEVQGEIGTVQEIQIFNTRLLTPNNQAVYIPNGILSNGVIKNYTQEGKRRTDLTIGIAYNADIKKAKEILLEIAYSHPYVLKEPNPMIVVTALADSSINLAVRVWAENEHFFTVSSDMLENGKVALEKAGISIPFPQREVTIINKND
jgi:small conductance mechanosensitive channel